MTAVKRMSLVCDHGKCPRTFRGTTDEPLRETRSTARVFGWIYIPGHPTTGGGRDLCPHHRHTP